MSSNTILISEIMDIIKLNDISKIKDILFSEGYLGLTQNEKESEIFNTIHLEFDFFQNGREALEYMIFDYNISAENSINTLVGYANKEVKAMFDARSLADELPQKTAIPASKIKV